MSYSARNDDHQRLHSNSRGPRHAHPRHGRRPLVAALLGVLGFAVLLTYTILGTGAAAQAAGTQQKGAIALSETQTVHVKQSTITDAGCQGGGTVHTGVFFVITGISDADAPSSVHVFWNDGTEGDAPSSPRRAGWLGTRSTSPLASPG